VTVDEAREAYLAAMATASAEFHDIYDRAAAKYAKAMREARLSNTQLTPQEVAAYAGASTRAAAMFDDIMPGPSEDIDYALAEAKEHQ
jgi:hypothetical protein